MHLTHIPRVEIHPVSHCTLACAGCQHGVPHRGRQVHEIGDYLHHLNTLATFASWDTLIIGGGEPFLHPGLSSFIRACKLGKPAHLFTNGFWLLRPDWLEVAGPAFGVCSAAIVSRYPIYVDRIGVIEWDRRLDAIGQKTGCHIGAFHPYDPAQLTFTHHSHHHEPLPILQPPQCSMRHCFQLLPEGLLAKCPLGRWHDRIPGGTDEWIAAADRSLFWDLAWRGSGFSEWAQLDAVEACSYCGLGTGHNVQRPWRNDGHTIHAGARAH